MLLKQFESAQGLSFLVSIWIGKLRYEAGPTSEFPVSLATVANCAAASSCSSIAAAGVAAFWALRAWDCAWSERY